MGRLELGLLLLLLEFSLVEIEVGIIRASVGGGWERVCDVGQWNTILEIANSVLIRCKLWVRVLFSLRRQYSSHLRDVVRSGVVMVLVEDKEHR